VLLGIAKIEIIAFTPAGGLRNCSVCGVAVVCRGAGL